MSEGRMQERKPSGVLVALALVAAGVAGYLLGSRRQRSNIVPKTPLTSRPPPFDTAMIQRAPPAQLDAHSIDAFVRWVAATPVSNAQAVRDAVAAARTDDEAARALIASFLDLPVRDIGRHQLLVSIIGEMRRPEFAEPLVRFIELPSDSIVRDVSADLMGGAYISHLDAAALLKARAVEMLAYLRTAEALQAVLTFASNHDSRAVRLAALDAYTYNHEDSPDAIDRARAAARPDETKLVGLPRLTRDSDPTRFAARIAAFYEQYPEERPPTPHIAGKRVHERSPGPRTSR
jgi:hypothetical protein